MSTVKANSHQVGQSVTAANNFTLYQPSTPDGTVRLGVGNAGATTADIITASSTGVTIPSVSSNNTFGFKNRIINGGMVIDQRNAGASVTPGNAQYLLDRWQSQASQSSKFSVQQSSTAPVGFSSSLKVTSLSSYSVGASDFFAVIQAIEGYNVADLAWGNASAKAVTLSFWAYSSLTGTFGGSIISGSGTYPFTYSIPSANTWTYVSVSVLANTSYSPTSTTNGVGAYVCFGLGVGSTYNGTAGSWQSGFFESATGATSVVGTNGATFYITGVQLEIGSQATSFDFRSYGQELALCQRYYQKFIGSGGHAIFSSYGATYNYANWIFKVTMRATPTIAGYTNGTITVNPDSAATYSAGSTYGCFGYNGTAYGTATASAEL